MKSQTKIVARYAETDKMGVVHHAVYPIWYEVARADFIKTSGITYTQMEQMGIMLPLLSCECRYLKPAFYEDELNVVTSISLLTPSKIEFDYEIYNSENKLINHGKTMHAFTSTALKPMNMKKHFAGVYNKIEKMKIIL